MSRQEKCNELFRRFINTIEKKHYSDHSPECDGCIKRLVEGVFQIVLPNLKYWSRRYLRESLFDDLFGSYFDTNKESIGKNSLKSPEELWKEEFKPLQVPDFLCKFNEMMGEEIRSQFLTPNVNIYMEYLARYKYALKKYYKYDEYKDILRYEWIIETPGTNIIDIVLAEISSRKQKRQKGRIKYATAVKSIERYTKNIIRELSVNSNHIQRDELINKLTENKRCKEREQILCEIAFDRLEDPNASHKRTNRKNLEEINILQEADVESDDDYVGSSHDPNLKKSSSIITVPNETIEFYGYETFLLIDAFFANRGQERVWAEAIFKYYDSPNTLICIAGKSPIKIDEVRKICWPNIEKKSTNELLSELTTLTGKKWNECTVQRIFDGLIFEISALFDKESMEDSKTLRGRLLKKHS